MKKCAIAISPIVVLELLLFWYGTGSLPLSILLTIITVVGAFAIVSWIDYVGNHFDD